MRLYSFELAYYFGLSGVQEKYSFYTQYTQKIIIIEIQTFHVIPPTFKANKHSVMKFKVKTKHPVENSFSNNKLQCVGIVIGCLKHSKKRKVEASHVKRKLIKEAKIVKEAFGTFGTTFGINTCYIATYYSKPALINVFKHLGDFRRVVPVIQGGLSQEIRWWKLCLQLLL